MATDHSRLFLITGATGKTGRTTVNLLLERGYRVRAFVHRPVSIEHFADILASAGRSPHFVQHISSVAVDYQNGIFSGTNNLIEVIGNRTPLTVEEFVTSRKDAFQRNGPLYEPAIPGR